MPSFDIVSKINIQEIDNAVNSALRELTNRYDFKGAVFSVELKSKENIINISADSEYKLEAVRDSLKVFATKRGIDVKALEFCEPQKAGGTTLKQEIKLKVQASIKADEVRIDGKKRDDLQEAMSIIRSTNFEIPLQFINFRE